MKNTKRILGLIFTKGISLKIWLESGLFEREKLIYEKHLQDGNFDNIYWYTYGEEDYSVYQKLLSERRIDCRIKVISMPKIFRGYHGNLVYSLMLPVIQHKTIRRLSIVKTNQMQGAWTAELIKKIYRIPYILRTGYTHSLYLHNCYIEEKDKKRKKEWLREYKRYRVVEKWLYHVCNYAMVSSQHDKQYIVDSYQILENKIRVVTNYIDCTLFKPEGALQKNNRIVFVGRLNAVKNLENTIKGVNDAGYGIDILGDGEEREYLENYIKNGGYDACLKGRVANNQLPEILNQYSYYILASEHEGMPKTLLEAMACGLLCMGTEVPGIKEVIMDGKNGFLIPDTTSESIKKTVMHVIDFENKDAVKSNAVEYVRQKHSLDQIEGEEMNVMSWL